MFTHTAQCSSELYNKQNILTFMFFHHALWYNYETWTNEMRTFQINTLFQFFNFDVFYMFRTVLRMNPWGSKRAEAVKNWKTELQY